MNINICWQGVAVAWVGCISAGCVATDDRYCGVSATGTVSCTDSKLLGQPSDTVSNKKFKQVSLGLEHGCGILEDNSVFCWKTTSTPTQYDNTLPNVHASTCFLTVEAGEHHTCAIKCADNKAVCWGRNDAQQATPPSQHAFSSVSSSSRFSCGIERHTGKLVCWGDPMPALVEKAATQKPLSKFSCVKNVTPRSETPSSSKLAGCPQESSWASTTVSKLTQNQHDYSIYSGATEVGDTRGLCCGISADAFPNTGKLECYYHGFIPSAMFNADSTQFLDFAPAIGFGCGTLADNTVLCSGFPGTSPKISCSFSQYCDGVDSSSGTQGALSMATLQPQCYRAPTVAPTDARTPTDAPTPPIPTPLASAPAPDDGTDDCQGNGWLWKWLCEPMGQVTAIASRCP